MIHSGAEFLPAPRQHVRGPPTGPVQRPHAAQLRQHGALVLPKRATPRRLHGVLLAGLSRLLLLPHARVVLR